MILDVHPRSRIRISDPGVKKVPDPGSGSSTLSFGPSQLFISWVSTVSPTLQNKYLLFYVTNLKTKKDPFSPSGQMANLCDVSCNVLTLALALLCASASLSRSFSYLSWASPPPPPSGGFGAGPFSTPSFFGLSEPENKHKLYKECGSRRCYWSGVNCPIGSASEKKIPVCCLSHTLINRYRYLTYRYLPVIPKESFCCTALINTVSPFIYLTLF